MKSKGGLDTQSTKYLLTTGVKDARCGYDNVRVRGGGWIQTSMTLVRPQDTPFEQDQKEYGQETAAGIWPRSLLLLGAYREPTDDYPTRRQKWKMASSLTA